MLHMTSTFVQKITFALKHPQNQGAPLVRSLIVSDTVHIPEHYPNVPSMEDLGFVRFDYRDRNDEEKIHALIRKEVIRSKVDGLSPAGVSEVMRTVNESTIDILTTASDKLNSRWVRRFGVKLTMKDREKESLWLCPSSKDPIYHFVGGEWSGVGDPAFYDTCVFVSKIVASQKAEDVLRRWKELGFYECPVQVDVQEVCYARQVIQLSTEFQADALAGGINAFATYRSARLVGA